MKRETKKLWNDWVDRQEILEVKRWEKERNGNAWLAAFGVASGTLLELLGAGIAYLGLSGREHPLSLITVPIFGFAGYKLFKHVGIGCGKDALRYNRWAKSKEDEILEKHKVKVKK